MRLEDCHNIMDFQQLARQRLPYPVFHYIDGAADDEVTYRRNTASFDACDLVPDVLAGVETIDMGTTIMGRKVDLPVFLSPTALQRLFHWQGERAVGAAAQKFNTWFGISSLATVSIEEIGRSIRSPKMLQLYVHKDKGLNIQLVDRAKAAGFDALAITVDTIVGGNRERCKRTGFTTPIKLTPRSALSFLLHPRWLFDYATHEKFSLPNLEQHIAQGSHVSVPVAQYFTQFLDQSMDWKTVSGIRSHWGGTFCLKGVMSVGDAQRAVDMGADAIMISNHGGRQLDGSRSPFDQISEIADAVGGRIEIICDGGIRRGTHVLKALCAGATACSGGRLYLYALAAAGQAGVERALGILRDELERDMKLMGVTHLSQLSRDRLRWRN